MKNAKKFDGTHDMFWEKLMSSDKCFIIWTFSGMFKHTLNLHDWFSLYQKVCLNIFQNVQTFFLYVWTFLQKCSNIGYVWTYKKMFKHTLLDTGEKFHHEHQFLQVYPYQKFWQARLEFCSCKNIVTNHWEKQHKFYRNV